MAVFKEALTYTIKRHDQTQDVNCIKITRPSSIKKYKYSVTYKIGCRYLIKNYTTKTRLDSDPLIITGREFDNLPYSQTCVEPLRIRLSKVQSSVQPPEIKLSKMKYVQPPEIKPSK